MVTVGMTREDLIPPGALQFSPEAVAGDPESCLAAIRKEVERRGGMQTRPGRVGGTTHL
jgi:hypothetical protein